MEPLTFYPQRFVVQRRNLGSRFTSKESRQQKRLGVMEAPTMVSRCFQLRFRLKMKCQLSICQYQMRQVTLRSCKCLGIPRNVNWLVLAAS